MVPCYAPFRPFWLLCPCLDMPSSLESNNHSSARTQHSSSMKWLSHLTVPNVAAAAAVIVLTRIAWQASASR